MRRIHRHSLLILALVQLQPLVAPFVHHPVGRLKPAIAETPFAERTILSTAPNPHRYRHASRAFILQTATTTDQQQDNHDDTTTKTKTTNDIETPTLQPQQQSHSFNLTTALFCAGLAFDAYAEPPANSSRWERGSAGLKVAFLSPAFTRALYKGLVEVKPISCSDLPEEDSSAAEGLLSGGGIDASLWVAVVESQYKRDLELLQKQEFHNGVFDLNNAAHVGKSRTAWSNTDERKSKGVKKQSGLASPYHIKGGWGKGGQAIFTEDEPPFYLYVQEPSSARLVFTLVDDNVVDQPLPISSAIRRLSDLIPLSKVSSQELVNRLKEVVQEQVKERYERNETALPELDDIIPKLSLENKGWTGSIKLTNKPRKRSKSGQMMLGAAAGAWVAGPVGAAVGGAMASLYEGQVRGRIDVRLRYLPIPQIDVPRPVYEVKGGLPGVDWGDMYDKYIAKQLNVEVFNETTASLGTKDGELIFIIDHDETGGCCAVYRSLEKRMLVVSFRGTCKPKDIFTDAQIAQDAWVEGEDVQKEGILKVHSGFRRSMNSISRRLKELVLAAVAPGEDISEYDVLVTGHSLGGALATLFAMDIGQYGIDAGRALPQTDKSDAWWTAIANTVMGKSADESKNRDPPRPKSLRMYNFGSPRVGNKEFADKFDSLVQDGLIDEAYRVVNGEDLVARHPRTMNAFVFGNVGYEHCGRTALVSMTRERGEDDEGNAIVYPQVWVEGESNDEDCPVRDGTPLTSPLADGSLLADLLNSTRQSWENDGGGSEGLQQLASYAGKVQKMASKVSERLKSVSATDFASIVGVDKKFTQREMRMIDSILKGEALAHHMEDEYYAAIGRACGFEARVGEPLRILDELMASATENRTDVIS